MSDPREPLDGRASFWALGMSTFAFAMCFAAWMMNGVLITYLVDNGVYDWTPGQMGWLIGTPVLTGSIVRLPLGLATDRWGGRWVFSALLIVASVPMYLVSVCDSFEGFLLAALGFGLSGGGFAIGIAYSSVWFSSKRQGLALGIFGAGNAGAALTTMLAPTALSWLTSGGEEVEGWRHLPKIYAAILLATGVLFLLTTKTRLPVGGATKTLGQRLAPLKQVRVWRFGLYYFFVFGGFVALAQWLVPYYVNAYATTVALAGLLAAVNSFPSGVIRALGGWMSDRWGARTVMYWVFGTCLLGCALLVFPRMDITAPGSGVMARASGRVTEVTAERVVVHSDRLDRDFVHVLAVRQGEIATQEERDSGLIIWPRSRSWQEPAVEVGQEVPKKALLARGQTHIFFQANIWIFTVLSFLIGASMGIGKAAVYKHIPDYFPNDVGAVGGIVGVIGGLGGFVCPVIFGYLLDWTGLWTSSWLFFLILILVCLVWMHLVVRAITRRRDPEGMGTFENPEDVAGERARRPRHDVPHEAGLDRLAAEPRD